MPSLYIMRHGQAESGANKADEDRQLTPTGRFELQTSAQGLRRAKVQFDRILSSPLIRAVQTAEIVGGALSPQVPLQEVADFSPGASEATMVDAIVRVGGSAKAILVVGHMPDLAALVGYLTRDPASGAGLPFKPGAMAWVEWNGQLTAANATLRWFLQPQQLSGLA